MRGNSRYREDKGHPISNILIQLGLSFANIVLSDFETLSGILWENRWVGVALIRYLEQQGNMTKLAN